MFSVDLQMVTGQEQHSNLKRKGQETGKQERKDASLKAETLA